jgi:hypothetical protein
MTKSKEKVKYAPAPAEYRLDFDRTWARVSFLEAAEKYTPEVLEGLRSRVLPAYQPHHPSSARTLEKRKLDLGWSRKVMGHIRAHVLSWADEFHLRGKDPSTSEHQSGVHSLLSCMELLITVTLLEWQADPSRSSIWGFPPSKFSAHAGLECPAPFVFDDDGWALLGETEAVFAKRVRTKFECQLREYMEMRRREAEGLVPIPYRVASIHFGFLALYQCLRYSHTKIARQFRCSRTSVGAGIRQAAEAIIGESYQDWLMPPQRAGRPRADGRP